MGVLSNQNNSRRDSTDFSITSCGNGDTSSLLERLRTLEQENTELKKKLNMNYSEAKNNNLPSREEIESISSMIDIINKIDEGTLEKIERLNKHD